MKTLLLSLALLMGAQHIDKRPLVFGEGKLVESDIRHQAGDSIVISSSNYGVVRCFLSEKDATIMSRLPIGSKVTYMGYKKYESLLILNPCFVYRG